MYHEPALVWLQVKECVFSVDGTLIRSRDMSSKHLVWSVAEGVVVTHVSIPSTAHQKHLTPSTHLQDVTHVTWSDTKKAADTIAVDGSVVVIDGKHHVDVG